MIERNLALPKPDEKLKCGYNPKDLGFIELVKAVVLGTYTIFSYDPSEDECKALYSRIKGIPSSSLTGDLDP